MTFMVNFVIFNIHTSYCICIVRRGLGRQQVCIVSNADVGGSHLEGGCLSPPETITTRRLRREHTSVRYSQQVAPCGMCRMPYVARTRHVTGSNDDPVSALRAEVKDLHPIVVFRELYLRILGIEILLISYISVMYKS